MRLYRAHGMTIASDMPLPGLRAARPGSGCDVRFEQAAVSASCTWFNHWRIGRQTPHVSFGRTGRGVLVRFRDLAEFEVSTEGGVVWCDPRGLPSTTLAHLVLDQVLPLALSQMGLLVLHASAVWLPGADAIAFAGRTGRGKSTLAAAVCARGGRLLADDCLRIAERDGVADAVPAHPGVRMWPDAAGALGPGTALTPVAPGPGTVLAPVAHYSAKRRVTGGPLTFEAGARRLAAVYLLSARHPRGAPIVLRRIRGRDRFIALARHTVLMEVHDRARLAASFSRLAALVSNVPVLRLGVVNSLGALPAVADAIVGHARTLAAPPLE